jgi:DNA ligase (NAD+)
LDRFGEKSAQNLLTAIYTSKTKPLSNFIFALGIPYIGEVSAKLLSNHFLYLDRFLNATKVELLNIQQIGPTMATAIVNIISSQSFQQLMTDFKKYNINPTVDKIKTNALKNETFVITGTMRRTRQQIESYIKENGGRVMASVSQNTNYLVLGDSPGKKYRTAIDINRQGATIQIINEDQLFNL